MWRIIKRLHFQNFEDFHLAPPALEVVGYIFDRVHNRVALETFWLVPVQGFARFLSATITCEHVRILPDRLVEKMTRDGLGYTGYYRVAGYYKGESGLSVFLVHA